MNHASSAAAAAKTHSSAHDNDDGGGGGDSYVTPISCENQAIHWNNSNNNNNNNNQSSSTRNTTTSPHNTNTTTNTNTSTSTSTSTTADTTSMSTLTNSIVPIPSSYYNKASSPSPSAASPTRRQYHNISRGRGALIQAGTIVANDRYQYTNNNDNAAENYHSIIGHHNMIEIENEEEEEEEEEEMDDDDDDDVEHGDDIITAPDSDYASRLPPSTTSLWILDAANTTTAAAAAATAAGGGVFATATSLSLSSPSTTNTSHYSSNNSTVSTNRTHNNNDERNLHPTVFFHDNKAAASSSLASMAQKHHQQQQQQQQRKLWTILGCVSCLLIAGIITVAILLVHTDNDPIDDDGNDRSTIVTDPPTFSPTMDPFVLSLSHDQKVIYDIISSMVVIDPMSLHNETSPQYQALHWILVNDQIWKVGYNISIDSTKTISRITQRFVLATLYYALNGTNWLKSYNWLVADECVPAFWRGIDCHDDDDIDNDDDHERMVRAIALGTYVSNGNKNECIQRNCKMIYIFLFFLFYFGVFSFSHPNRKCFPFALFVFHRWNWYEWYATTGNRTLVDVGKFGNQE
jgi:hypothetical protein